MINTDENFWQFLNLFTILFLKIVFFLCLFVGFFLKGNLGVYSYGRFLVVLALCATAALHVRICCSTMNKAHMCNKVECMTHQVTACVWLSSFRLCISTTHEIPKWPQNVGIIWHWSITSERCQNLLVFPLRRQSAGNSRNHSRPKWTSNFAVWDY